jgi:hypothetical protein
MLCRAIDNLHLSISDFRPGYHNIAEKNLKMVATYKGKESIKK